MKKSAIILAACGIAAGTVLSGLLWGWLASRVPNPISQTPDSAIQANQSSLILSQTPQQPDPRAIRAGRFTPAVMSAAPNRLSNWKETVENILNSESEEKEKSQRLLELFPNLPQDGQIAAAEHLSILLPNQDYAALGQYLTNATTPEAVLEVLMAGLLNRPDTLKLPYLLDVARDEQNPKAGEAKGLLQALLDENFGNDWTRWQAKVDQWVTEYSD